MHLLHCKIDFLFDESTGIMPCLHRRHT